MPVFGFGLLRRLTSRDGDKAALDPACKVPLTERNVKFFNDSCKPEDKDVEDEDDFSDLESLPRRRRFGWTREGREFREVRVVEWLRLVPSVCSSSPPAPPALSRARRRPLTLHRRTEAGDNVRDDEQSTSMSVRRGGLWSRLSQAQR